MLKKLFRPSGPIRWTIFEKEMVDEIIFGTTQPRNRLMLELMARGGMRISVEAIGRIDNLYGQTGWARSQLNDLLICSPNS